MCKVIKQTFVRGDYVFAPQPKSNWNTRIVRECSIQNSDEFVNTFVWVTRVIIEFTYTCSYAH